LITGKDENRFVIIVIHAAHNLPHGIGCTLKPVFIGRCLLSSEYVDKTLTKGVKVVAVFDVAVEGRRIVLGEYEYALITGIETVADGNIDQAVFTCQRYSGLRPFRR